jgi:Zn-dependent protease with chaperone function
MGTLSRRTRWAAAFFCVAAAGLAQQRVIKPGINLFSKEQDIQMGKEYAAQVNAKMPVIRNAELTTYIERIGRRLAAAPEADKYPYTFQVVQDKSINAFALPGGPTFTHTGLIMAADNEAQIAGVLAHEIAHVALRHGTSQASKAQAFAVAASLGGALAGEGLIAQMAQAGIGLGANSVLLKFSRNAERDADLLGARIMAQAGYNPVEMARFFEKLEAESGKGSAITEFFSNHPNPGNRVKSVEQEIRYLPQRNYSTDSRQLPRVKRIIGGLPEIKSPSTSADPRAIPSARPSTRLRSYQGREVVFSYPENWEVLHSDGNAVTIAAKAGVVGSEIAYGLLGNFHPLQDTQAPIERQTEALLQVLIKDNPGMVVNGRPRRATISGHQGLVTTLQKPSVFQGATEVNTLLTIQRPGGLFYLVLVAPSTDWNSARSVFDQIVRSVQFPN